MAALLRPGDRATASSFRRLRDPSDPAPRQRPARELRAPAGRRSASWIWAFLGVGVLTLGCNRNHWAQVEVSPLPVPPGQKVLHTGRLVIAVTARHHETQCVVDEKHHPICFFQLRDALHRGLARGLWPAFPEIVTGSPRSARPGDYVLQVEVTLDALRPDENGPGWSAGARSRYRLLRDGEVLAEKTMASRSRPHFPYGAPLGEGATEVVDATIVSIARTIAAVPETRPEKPVLLPQVATRTVVDPSEVRTARATTDPSPAERRRPPPSENVRASAPPPSPPPPEAMASGDQKLLPRLDAEGTKHTSAAPSKPSGSSQAKTATNSPKE